VKPSRYLRRLGTYEQLAKEQELARLTEENARLAEQIKRCNRQIKASNEQLLQLKQRYTSLINELSMREKAAEQISRLALREANTVIETAKGNADLIVKEALVQAKAVFLEINRLTKETTDAKEQIQSKLLQMNGLLDSFKIPETPDLDEIIRNTKKTHDEH